MTDDEPDEDETPHARHTVCHHCSGAGDQPVPMQALIGGVPRTVEATRPCPWCKQSGHLPGIVPPV